jgi:hypothetical protein
MRSRKRQPVVSDFFAGMFLVALLTLLIAIQAVLFCRPDLGPLFNTALRLEGSPLNSEEYWQYAGDIAVVPWACLTLRMAEYAGRSEVKVLVDGRETADFLQNEVTVNVRQGSLVTVFNPDSETAVTVTVSKTTPNIRQPSVNSRVSGTKNLSFEPVILE